MVEITYVEFDGTEHTVRLAPGLTLMEGALHNDIPGIEAECGGACACATCYVELAEGWLDSLGQKSRFETEMLECAGEVKPTSRLSCQIKITESHNGLVVHMPQSQQWS